MIELIGKLIPNVTGNPGDAIPVPGITEQEHLKNTVHIVVVPLGTTQNSLSQKLQMSSQTNGIQIIGVQFNAIGVLDDLHNTTDQLQRIICLFAIHLSGGKLQGDVSGFIFGQFCPAQLPDLFQ